MNRALLRGGAPWPSPGLIACGRPCGASALQGLAGRAVLQHRDIASSSQARQGGLTFRDSVRWREPYRPMQLPRSTRVSPPQSRFFSTTLRSQGHGTHPKPLLPSNSPTPRSNGFFSGSTLEALDKWRNPGATQRQVRVYVDEASKSKSTDSLPKPRHDGTEGMFKARYEPPTLKDQKSSGHNYLRQHLPGVPHLYRPSKEELLAAASGFFSRLKIRFKWASIRSMRPFNNDEIGAFISLIAFGHVIWLFIGTTTFISLAIWAVNTVFAQEKLAKWIGSYLTKSSGLQVVFESAVVPKWGDGVISFHNVFVSRRPGLRGGNVTQGSPETAAAAQAAAAVAEANRDQAADIPEEDQNYTQFDVSIDAVNVTLSFTKWWNSKGLLQDVEVKGVRGVVDRTHVHHIDGVDPRSYKAEHHAGDFEIENFRLEDVLVTLHQPGGFRPFSVSVYTCELPRLRKQWLFYDFLSASHCSGAYDDAQFNIHPRQMHGRVSPSDDEAESAGPESPWRKHNRLRIDSLNIDHLNTGVEGAFGWITRGNVDIVADVMFPADLDESISKVVADMYNKLESTISGHLHLRVGDEHTIQHNGAQVAGQESSGIAPKPSVYEQGDATDRRCIVMDLKVRINDIRAMPPAFPKDISYIDNALIRPIVAFLNSRPNWVPINGRLVKRVRDFDGSWTLFDSGLMDEISEELYNSCVRDLSDSESRARRFRKVGIWSLQLVAQALFIGLVGNIS